jgi:hypothetical protein
MLQFQSLEEHMSEVSAYYKNEAVPWLRRLVTSLLLRRHVFVLELVNLGFVAYKLAMGQFLQGDFGFSLTLSFRHHYIYIYIIWE